MSLYQKYETQKGLRQHYQEMFEVTAQEFKFANMRIANYRQVLSEIEELCNLKVNPEVIAKLIKNFRERDILDISIHHDVECHRIKDTSFTD